MELFLLLLSGISEIIMFLCLNKSQGFTEKRWILPVMFFAVISFLLLSKAMTTMEIGVAYSIWVAMGSLGSLVLGAVLFKNRLSKMELASVFLVLLSIIGLKIS